MSELKSKSGSGLSIRVGLSGFLNYFVFGQIRTIELGHQIIRFMCNFGPNSLEKLINTTSEFGQSNSDIKNRAQSAITLSFGHNV